MKYKEIYHVKERNQTQIPLSDLLINGKIDINKESQNAGFFHVAIRLGELIITAGKYVGLIPINEMTGLFVEPKIGNANWLYLVDRIQGHVRNIYQYRTYNMVEDMSLPMVEFLIDSFCAQLEVIYQEGLIAKYRRRSERTQFPHGKINFNKTITNAWGKGYKKSVFTDYYIFSRNTFENRVLNYAIHISLQLLKSYPTSSNLLKERLSIYKDLFQLIPLDNNFNYLQTSDNQTNRYYFPQTRKYYKEAINTAILLITQTGLDPSQLEETKAFSFVVDMETLFEKYCQEILKDNQSLLGEQITVKDQNDGRKHLFSSGPDKRFAEPDILILQNQFGAITPLSVIEVKYKQNPTRNDINQLITYIFSYNVTNGILLCFTETRGSVGWEYLGNINESADIWIYRLYLSEEDIQQGEFILTTELHDYFSARMASR